MTCFIGIDTSCYTTSLAVIDENTHLVAESRKLLLVPPGKRGLSQSEMVFQHTRSFPVLFAEIFNTLSDRSFQAVGVSVCPRPLADSYMPAFLVGKGAAEVIALSQGIECYGLSHQENHIYAGLWSVGAQVSKEFLALHVSGGTTELVKVLQKGAVLEITLLSASQDISAGQLIDRTGVKLALPFPSGPSLEKCAALSQKKFNQGDYPVAVHSTTVSFSGPETYLAKLITSGAAAPDIAAVTQLIVAETLSKMIEQAVIDTGLTEILLVGGVMSNQFLRKFLLNSVLQLQFPCKLFFAQQEFSSDHAVGAAYFAFLKHHSQFASIR
jgi:N6-L-threonylcarbamoyladenine synthase